MWRRLLFVCCLVCLSGCVYLFNNPPYAHFVYGPTEGYAPLTVSFNGSSSSDPDGQSLSYRWEFGDGYTAYGKYATHTYNSPGTYTAYLQVEDSMGLTCRAHARIDVLEPQLRYHDFPRTSDGFWEFVFYCQEHWVYEEDFPGEPCQSPSTSNARMRGDCDDYAVMIAYCTQEYFGYDSKVYLLDIPGTTVGHAVAGVAANMEIITWYYSPCPYSPHTYVSGANGVHLLIDMERCIPYGPDDVFLLSSYEWFELAGSVLSVEADSDVCESAFSLFP